MSGQVKSYFATGGRPKVKSYSAIDVGKNIKSYPAIDVRLNLNVLLTLKMSTTHKFLPCLFSSDSISQKRSSRSGNLTD